MHARPRPHVHDMVRRANHVLIMLDNQHGVANVRKMPQRRDEPVVVALVQPDGRLVQHIARADEPRPNL